MDIVLFILLIIFIMSFLVLICLLSFKKTRDYKTFQIVSASILFFLGIFLLLVLYYGVGIPIRESAISHEKEEYFLFSPFSSREIYQKYWDEMRGSEYLFSVVEITKTEQDTLKEIFSREKFVPDLFVVLNDKFYPITEEQKNTILELNLNEEQIKKFLGWK